MKSGDRVDTPQGLGRILFFEGLPVFSVWVNLDRAGPGYRYWTDGKGEVMTVNCFFIKQVKLITNAEQFITEKT